jgi:hypothetical protein
VGTTLVDDTSADDTIITDWSPPDPAPAAPPPPTLVVVHPAPEGPQLDAYIAGREPVRIDTAAELNALLGGLGIRHTTLIGLSSCDTPSCGYAATTATLTATPDAYRFERACDDHHHATADAYTITDPGTVRAVYVRRFATEVADLARFLIGHPVPEALFAQPACGNCHARLAPELAWRGDAAPRVTWLTAEGSRSCGRNRNHNPAPGEVGALITRYVQDMRAQLRDADAALDRLAS